MILIYYLIPKKKITICTREKINKYGPSKKFIAYNPFPFRSFIDFSSNSNNINYSSENEKNTPYSNLQKSHNFPLITRKDLLKYLKKKNELLKLKKNYVSFGKIREKNEKIIFRL